MVVNQTDIDSCDATTVCITVGESWWWENMLARMCLILFAKNINNTLDLFQWRCSPGRHTPVDAVCVSLCECTSWDICPVWFWCLSRSLLSEVFCLSSCSTRRARWTLRNRGTHTHTRAHPHTHRHSYRAYSINKITLVFIYMLSFRIFKNRHTLLKYTGNQTIKGSLKWKEAKCSSETVTGIESVLKDASRFQHYFNTFYEVFFFMLCKENSEWDV